MIIAWDLAAGLTGAGHIAPGGREGGMRASGHDIFLFVIFCERIEV